MKQPDLLYEYLDTAPPEDTFTLDELTRKRILNDALAKAGISRKNAHSKRLWTVLIAAMLTLCCVTTTAAERFRLNDAFLERMDFPSQTQIEQLENAGAAVGQSYTADDITITIEGTVGDRNAAYIFFSVLLPEEYKIPAPTYGDTTWFWFNSYTLYTESSGSQGYRVEMLSQEGHTLRFLLSMDANRTLTGENIELSLSKLNVIIGNDSKTVSEGPWNFSFPMEHTDTSIEIPFSGTIRPVAENGLRLKEIRVSPISLQLNFVRPLSILWEEKHRSTRALLDMPITLCLADGSKITDEMMIDSSTSSQGFTVQLIRKYRSLIDPSQLTGIWIGEIYIPVEE